MLPPISLIIIMKYVRKTQKNRCFSHLLVLSALTSKSSNKRGALESGGIVAEVFLSSICRPFNNRPEWLWTEINVGGC